MAYDPRLMKLTAEIVSAHGSKDRVSVNDIGDLLSTVHKSLSELSGTKHVAVQSAEAIGSSIRRNHLVCLKCGRKLKMLKRHLGAVHGLTPEQYRDDLGLPSTYPMVSAEFARERRQLARSLGLGRKRTSS